MNSNANSPVRIDPEVVALLRARARKARSQAMANLVVRLINKLTPRLGFRPWGEHWG